MPTVTDAVGTGPVVLLADLDRRYPGIRFRMIDEQDGICPHVRIFVNRESVAGLEETLAPGAEMAIFRLEDPSPATR